MNLGLQSDSVSKQIVVDIHAHLIPRELLDPLKNGEFCGLGLRDVNGNTALMIRGRRTLISIRLEAW